MVKYRIIERELLKGNWVPFGVAYEREKRVFLFVPAWRGQRALDVSSVSKLNGQNLPSQSFPYRWSEEVYEWMKDDTFRPIAALKEYPPPILVEVEKLFIEQQLIEQRKYLFFTTIQVQIVDSVFKLIVLGRIINEALLKIYDKKQTATLVKQETAMLRDEEAGIETHELEIDLPEEAGKVGIEITSVPDAQVTITPNITGAGSEHVIVGYYKEGEEEFPTDYEIPNRSRESFPLRTGLHQIFFIEWGGNKWEIPFKVQ